MDCSRRRQSLLWIIIGPHRNRPGNTDLASQKSLTGSEASLFIKRERFMLLQLWLRMRLLLIFRVIRVGRRRRGSVACLGKRLLETGLLNDPVALGQEMLLLGRRLALGLSLDRSWS